MRECWAKGLQDCDGNISCEHIISECLLSEMIYVQGFSWCKEEKKQIGAANFVSKILCKKHNQLLSPTDTEILKFVKSVKEFNRNRELFELQGFSLKRIPIKFQIDGRLLEKWFCKTLTNIAMVNEKEALIPFEIILPYLFSDYSLEKPYGLSFAGKVGQELHMNDQIVAFPLFNETTKSTKELAGGLFILRGFYLIFLLPCSREPFRDNKLVLTHSSFLDDKWDDLQINWHNKEINEFRKRGRKKYKTQLIEFSW